LAKISHACQASVENVERAINRFFDNFKVKKPGKKGYPKFKKHSRSVEYKVSGWKLHPSKRRITFLDKTRIPWAEVWAGNYCSPPTFH
jgi:putative transposase